jgi:hypothetical protein
MTCPNCHIINTVRDVRCYGCGEPLQGYRGWGGDEGTPNAIPGWAYIFCGLCLLMPVIALGGCAPILLGVGGSSLCAGLARWRVIPAILRVLGCVFITGCAWILFAALMVAVTRL